MNPLRKRGEVDFIALSQKKQRYTLADVLAEKEESYIELIEGIPKEQEIPLRIHQEIRVKLGAQLFACAAGKPWAVYHVPLAVRLFEKDGDSPEDVDTLVEPDITVVCDQDKLDDLGCKGAPDLVMEVLSRSTQRHDRFTKFKLYQRAGVREYWLVDPDAKSAQVFLLEDGRYSAVDYGEVGDHLQVKVLEDCTIDLSLVFPE